MESSDLWISPHMYSVKALTSKGLRFLWVLSPQKLSAPPYTLAGKYIFKVMMKIFKWCFLQVKHCS